tara:strand:+ start:1682 stop:1858 length:177 start_codon:yes stop_codon:yes gene_type:complete
MGRKKVISIKDRKELNRLRQEVDVKINSFGLRLRRLENEILMLKTQNNEIKNLIKGEE